MGIKTTFRKQDFDYPMHECFFCRDRPTGILTFLWTGEEVRSCDKCAKLHRRGRKTAKVKGMIATLSKLNEKGQLPTGEIGQKPSEEVNNGI